MIRRLFLLFCVLATAAVNVMAADPAPAKPTPDKPVTPKKTETIVLAGGCFWCIEAVLQRIKGVEKVASGYIGGSVENPTYEQVCTGRTGHAEAVEVVHDPAVLPLDKLLEVFWHAHDPTTLNAQGPDHGTQYRSGIYYQTDDQKKIAEESKKKHQADFSSPIVTEILKASKFYKAEGYHQNYFNDNFFKGTGNYGYCRAIIWPKLKKLGLETKEPDAK